MATKTLGKTSGRRGVAASKGHAKHRPPPAKVALAADEIVNVTRRLDAARLRAAAVKLLARRRKDLEAVVAANRKSFEGIQAVVKRQTELLKAQIGEWRSVAKVMAIAGPAQSVAQLDELARGAFRLSLANVRELAELSVKAQAEAFEMVRSRIRQDLAEVSALLDGE
jgi:phasin family protein